MVIEKIKIISILIFLNLNSHAQSTPREYFDTQYTDAITYCKQNSIQINNTLSKSSINVDLAVSIVFPEMVRYSLWKDLFETKALEIMYVQKGKEVADFSIGWLQMKPSFVESLENILKQDSLLKTKYKEIYTYNSEDATERRKYRVERLKKFKWELLYLCAFIDVNTQRFDNTDIHTHDRLKYFAAAYNRGLNVATNNLTTHFSSKTFPYGVGRDNPFSYVEVAEYFYKTDSKQILLTK